MNIRKILLLGIVGATLTACQTMTAQERRAADEKTCLSYGFRPKTDAMATCLQRIDLDRRAESRAFRYGNDPIVWDWNRPGSVYR